jgi:hypothetical protein
VREFEANGRVELVNLDSGPHVGFVLSRRMTVRMDDGSEHEYRPGVAFNMPPGHGAWTEGDEPCVLLDFGGLKGYARARSLVADSGRRERRSRLGVQACRGPPERPNATSAAFLACGPGNG